MTTDDLGNAPSTNGMQAFNNFALTVGAHLYVVAQNMIGPGQASRIALVSGGKAIPL